MNDQRSENDKELICQLHNKRRHYCGMNIRNVRLILNRLGKTDKVALAYRYMLEIEDFNIKDYYIRIEQNMDGSCTYKCWNSSIKSGKPNLAIGGGTREFWHELGLWIMIDGYQ